MKKHPCSYRGPETTRPSLLGACRYRPIFIQPEEDNNNLTFLLRSTLPSLSGSTGHLLTNRRCQTSRICFLFDAPSLISATCSQYAGLLDSRQGRRRSRRTLDPGQQTGQFDSIPTHLQRAIDARACSISPPNNPLCASSSPDTQLTRPRSNSPPSFSPATSRPVVSSTSPSRATTQPNPPVPQTSSRSKNVSSIPMASRPPHPRFSVSATQPKLPSSWNGTLLT